MSVVLEALSQRQTRVMHAIASPTRVSNASPNASCVSASAPVAIYLFCNIAIAAPYLLILPGQ